MMKVILRNGPCAVYLINKFCT